MTRKGQSITLSISARDKAKLEELALELGMMWGEKPNISKLVETIARRQFLVQRNDNWEPSRIEALEQAMNALTDSGKILEAQEIAHLLLERSELSIPLRSKIEHFQNSPPPPWRIELDRYIHRQQPFQLSYQDATGRLWTFTIRHARITPHEKRQYLDCWCEETEANQDLPELQHNWCLRLDRISDAGIIPIDGKWHPNLDAIEVEMHLFGRLAFAYYPKQDDRKTEWMANQSHVKRVIRRISSTYWFLREIRPYGANCVVVTPQDLKEKIKQEIAHLYQLYHS
jgi:predicted DNA-binding transcriptional regulator YafY